MPEGDEFRRGERDTVDADSSIRAVQRAALEHALLSPTGDEEYVAFAGALERVRTEGQLSLSGVTVLTCLVSLHLGRRESGTLDFSDQRDGDPLFEGALVALERFDLSIADAASLANRAVDDFETELQQRSRTG